MGLTVAASPAPFYVLADDLADGWWLVDVSGRTGQVEVRWQDGPDRPGP